MKKDPELFSEGQSTVQGRDWSSQPREDRWVGDGAMELLFGWINCSSLELDKWWRMNGAFVLLGSVLVVLLDQDEDHGVCHQHGLHGYKHVIVCCQCQERQRVAYCHPPEVPRSRHEQVHQPPEAEESRAVWCRLRRSLTRRKSTLLLLCVWSLASHRGNDYQGSNSLNHTHDALTIINSATFTATNIWLNISCFYEHIDAVTFFRTCVQLTT